ncbi:MAG: cupin domain-containing protein [Chloroflexi bacterium]|nr:cupin domain-containing protein [Chloroflexota bacterium]
MALNIRRVVTANDENGKARVWIDDMASNLANPRPGVNTALIWTTDSTPADLTGNEDLGARMVARTPAHRGSTFRIIEFGPSNQVDMHITPTIDYALVLKGEIDMDLDDGLSVHLNEGDVLVQRATIHNWANHGTEPCVIAFILIDAQP